nr:hypothetical protein CFP56_09298 [Quercus suber]
MYRHRVITSPLLFHRRFRATVAHSKRTGRSLMPVHAARATEPRAGSSRCHQRAQPVPSHQGRRITAATSKLQATMNTMQYPAQAGTQPASQTLGSKESSQESSQARSDAGHDDPSATAAAAILSVDQATGSDLSTASDQSSKPARNCSFSQLPALASRVGIMAIRRRLAVHKSTIMCCRRSMLHRSTMLLAASTSQPFGILFSAIGSIGALSPDPPLH